MKLTGAEVLERLLANEGVTTAYGVVGGKLAALLHAIHRSQRIRFVGTRHEAAGAMMAAAAYAGTGRVALALGEMGRAASISPLAPELPSTTISPSCW